MTRTIKISCFSFFLLLISSLSAQVVNKELFLKEFNEADFKGKVRLVSNYEYNDIKDVFPLIEDTLEKIKKRVYSHTSSSEAKFLFEKIEASKAFDNNRFARAVYILEAAISNHARNTEDSLYCLNKLKHCYIKLNNLNKAVEANELFDKLAERSGQEKFLQQRIAKSYMYNAFGLIDHAINEKRKEFVKEFPKRKNDTDFISGHHNDLAVYFNKQKKSDSAIFHLDIADRYISAKLKYTANTTYYNFYKFLIQGNKALAYYNRGNYEDAIPPLKLDIYYSLKNSNAESAVNSYILIAECYLKIKNIRNAQLYADSAGKLVSETDQVKPKLNYLLLQAALLKAQNKFDMAVNKYEEYIKFKDSVSSHEKEILLMNQQIALDIQRKDSELSEKSIQLQSAKIKEAKQRAFKAYLLAGMVVLLLLIGILVYNNHSVKRKEFQLASVNDQIQRQNRLIEAALKEKDLLLREIHHRVKNNLQIISSIINIQSSKLPAQETKLLLDELKMRISSIALTHQMLYQKNSTNEVSLGDYVRHLIEEIDKSYKHAGVKTEIVSTTADISLNIDTIIPLGLLINEIITNAYKHAFVKSKEGFLRVVLSAIGNEVKMVISDNGPGLPENFEAIMKKHESLGLELIVMLADQINARMEIKNNGGAEFSISFNA